MDVLLYFKDGSSFPGQYLRTEVDALEVTWDDVDPGMPWVVEGNERVILGIIEDAKRDNNLEKVVIL